MTTERSGRIIRRPTLAGTVMHTLAAGFHALGHRVTLATAEDYRPTGPSSEPFEMLFFPTVAHRLFPPHLLPASPALARWMRAHARSYDLILAPETFSLFTLYAVRTAPTATVILQELDRHQRKLLTLPSRIWHTIIVPAFMRRAALVIPRSESARQFISRYLPAVSSEIVKHSVDTTLFTPSAVKRPYFLSPSRLDPLKGIDSIIRAFAVFRHRPGHDHWKLVIAGEGPDLSRLRNLAASESVADSVEFTGRLSHSRLSAICSHATATLFASRLDLETIAILESIACGTPVLTGSTPTSTDIILAHSLGIVADDWGADELERIVREAPRLSANCAAYSPRLSPASGCVRIIQLFRDRPTPHKPVEA